MVNNNMRYFTFRVLLYSLVICATTATGWEPSYASDNHSERLFSEQLIPVGKNTKDHYIFKDSIKYNSDQSKMTYVVKKDNKSIVSVNGDAGKSWDNIVLPTPIFSPDGDRVAYIGIDRKDVHLVVDGKLGPLFDKIWEVQFSPDSKHFAYLASLTDNKKSDVYLVINHRKGQKVLTIKEMGFSPDSRHLAYIAMLSDGKWHVIVDNQKEGPGFDIIYSIVWSPDSKHLSYIAGDKQLLYVVLDGKKTSVSGKFIGMTSFSPDSTQFAVAAYDLEEKIWTIYLNEKKIGSFPFVEQFKFSPDSKHYTFQGGESKNNFSIIYNGTAIGPYEECSLPVFSKDSSRFAYNAKKDDEWVMVVNGKEQKKYSAVYNPIFSADSLHLAYRVKTNDNMMRIVFDSQELKAYENVGTPIFSPKESRLAYAILENNEWFFNLDGNEGKRYDSLGICGFSEDGKLFVYTAKRNDKYFVVVNGQEGETTFDGTLAGSEVIFSSPQYCHFFVFKNVADGSELYRLDVKIK